jgi:hypothetical protein
MNQVLCMSNFLSNRRSRSVATTPKSPREIIVGDVISRAIAAEALSRSKVKQTIWFVMAVSPWTGLLRRATPEVRFPILTLKLEIGIGFGDLQNGRSTPRSVASDRTYTEGCKERPSVSFSNFRAIKRIAEIRELNQRSFFMTVGVTP